MTADPTNRAAAFRPFRAFRIATYASYLVVVVTFSLLVTVSVVRSVLDMSPRHRSVAAKSMTVEECITEAEQLWKALDAQRARLTAEASSSRADERWADFRVQWLNKHREIEAECLSEEYERRKLKGVFVALDRLMDLYTTHSVQFAGEVGPFIEHFVRTLEQAKPGNLD